MMKATRRASRLHQQGIAGVLGVIFLIVAVIFVLSQTLGITGSSSLGNKQQMDSVDAFFLAESGLERGQGILYAASDPTVGTVCTGITNTGDIALGRGKFTVRGTPTPTGCDSGSGKCTACTITSVGSIPATGTVTSSRTVVRVISLKSPSGGAYGCGGAGAASVACPTGAPAADWYPDIVQQIDVTAPSAILLSNMAYARHPAGNTNTNARTSVYAVSPPSPTRIDGIEQWNDESNHSVGSNVVGSRGASVLVPAAGTWQMKQNLTADSLFAAVGVRIQGTGLSITGSYWDDASNGTASNNGTASGQTSNGAACNPADHAGLCTAATPVPSVIPDPPSAGSKQASNSWCYDADTLVFGLSGNSVNSANGALSSFVFGAAPQSTPVPNGFAIYPATHTNGTQIYSALRYVQNPAYVSANADASSGEVTGAIGATFTGSISNTVTVTGTATAGSDQMTAISGETLSAGDVIVSTTCASNTDTRWTSVTGASGNTATMNAAAFKACTPGTFVFTHAGGANLLRVTAVTPGSGAIEPGSTISGGTIPNNTTIGTQVSGTGGVGTTYTLSKPNLTQASTAMTTTSNTLTVTGVTNGTLYANDIISGTGVTTGTTIRGNASISYLPYGSTTGTGLTGTYQLLVGGVDVPQHVNPGTAIKTSTITLSSGDGGDPASLTLVPRIAIRAGTGAFPANSCISGGVTHHETYASASSAHSSTQYKVVDYCGAPVFPTPSLSGASICGGICAFFNHDPTVNSGMTSFSIGIPNTAQWAAGMTCLKGVDASTIQGLTGRGATTRPAQWYEPVQ